MNPRYLDKMTATELDEYAKAIGLDVTKEKDAKAKAEAVRLSRARTVEFKVLGVPIVLSKANVRDKRVTDIFETSGSTPADIERAMRLMLGDAQWAQVVEACTDDDGTQDVDAMVYATAKIINSKELKNF